MKPRQNGPDLEDDMAMTTDEAADYLGVSVRRVRAMIGSGMLPAEREGRGYKIRRTDLRRMPRRPVGRPRTRR